MLKVRDRADTESSVVQPIQPIPLGDFRCPHILTVIGLADWPQGYFWNFRSTTEKSIRNSIHSLCHPLPQLKTVELGEVCKRTA